MPIPDLSALTDDDLVRLYPHLLKELKRRGIIHSKNVVGDLGERLAIATYNGTPGLPNLQAAPKGTQNVDAISRNGERYSIKTTTGRSTGVFFGLPLKGSRETPSQKFEYVVIVQFDSDYQLRGIYQVSWDVFVEHKKWQSRMNAWFLSVTKELLANARIIWDGKLG